MPLHLLSKKSWNVYNPENIARVKRDQAQAEAQEQEEDRRLQESDAARRLAVLRGDIPAAALEDESSTAHTSKLTDRRPDGEASRKRRRLHGEDDTDRDVRVAREQLETKHRRVDNRAPRSKPDVPITDARGHTNLFPIDHKVSARKHKNAEVEKEKARKQRELEDQYTMRFANAAGRDGSGSKPWYTASKRHEREAMEVVEGKDVWGRPDPSAKDREQVRQITNDPLAFMQRAQSQLKQAARDKERWADEEQARAPSRHQGNPRSSRHDERHRRRDRFRDRGHSHSQRQREHSHPDHKRKRSEARKQDRPHQNGSLPAITDDFKLDP